MDTQGDKYKVVERRPEAAPGYTLPEAEYDTSLRNSSDEAIVIRSVDRLGSYSESSGPATAVDSDSHPPSKPFSKRDADNSLSLHTSPTLSVENALQLHFDSVSEDTPQKAVSVNISDTSISDEIDDAAHLVDHASPAQGYEIGIPAGAHSLRVRFRSRVRIASGTGKNKGERYSTGSSPSSSISAPLRNGSADAEECANSQQENEDVIPYDDSFETTTAHWLQRHMMSPRVRRKSRLLRMSTENSLLISNDRGRRSYLSTQDSDDVTHEQYLAAMRRLEEEAVFGDWPRRLFNRHWWWWKISPVLCYCCNESDNEIDQEEDD